MDRQNYPPNVLMSLEMLSIKNDVGQEIVIICSFFFFNQGAEFVRSYK